MLTVPYYNLLLLPNITYHFQSGYFAQLTHTTATKGQEILFLILKRDISVENIQLEDIYPIGLRAVVEGLDSKGNIKVHTSSRVSILSTEITKGGISNEIANRPDILDIDAAEQKRRFTKMRNTLLHTIDDKQWAPLARNTIMQWESMQEMIVVLSGLTNMTAEEKYAILAADSLRKQTELIEQAFYTGLEEYKLQAEAETTAQEENEKLYKEAALKKQIQFLQNQLSGMHPESLSEADQFEKKIRESEMNDTARAEAMKLLNRLRAEGESGHEYGTIYDYLDFVTGLNWSREPAGEIDLNAAREILDRDHYGMKKVKERVLQQLAVMALNKKQSGSILLFVGAPGTGKTSVGQGIADALGRKYVRISLGGVRDEADIRGHRRTYVGAMAGRIMDGVRRSGVSNPVMVLDEVDKLSKDYSGDPASALLEVLDPEQNNSFTDHYMNVPYDLSDVLFVCTANTVDTIPEPLLNRMEVIEFASYTASEKLEIAKRHLLPKAIQESGLKPKNLKVTDDAIRQIISDYTMEAGVRGLRKQLDTICRSAAVLIVSGRQKSVTVSPKRLKEFLDTNPIRHDRALDTICPGVVTGLAWTQAGGDILFIETLFTKGSGQTIITGKLGDVMRESVQIAVSLVKAMYPEKAELFSENDLHIHVPAGAVPKDGPSAGVTLTTAIASLVLGKAAPADLAMTGEVSLRGAVLPIGGLPEKLMAATRAGIHTVLIPADNVEDLEDVAEEVRSALTIIPVCTVKDVLTHAGLVSDETESE